MKDSNWSRSEGAKKAFGVSVGLVCRRAFVGFSEVLVKGEESFDSAAPRDGNSFSSKFNFLLFIVKTIY